MLPKGFQEIGIHTNQSYIHDHRIGLTPFSLRRSLTIPGVTMVGLFTLIHSIKSVSISRPVVQLYARALIGRNIDPEFDHAKLLSERRLTQTAGTVKPAVASTGSVSDRIRRED